ncbi:transcriptional regulator [Kineosporia sp. NBRC 101677]|nr:transcriptional regulator [Kineosporia sp. NBRC 101677]
MERLPDEVSLQHLRLFIQREHEHLELKTGAGRKPLQEAFVAMSNTDGGTILIGVTDAREVVGHGRSQGLDDAVHSAATDAHNVGRYSIREIQVDGRVLVAVEVQRRNDEVAQTSDGRVLVRRGGHNQPLFGRDLMALLASRTLVRYESTDSGVRAADADPQLVRAVSRAFGWNPRDSQDRWSERGLLHESGNLSVAGALTLTDPATSLQAAKFTVDVRVYESDQDLSYVFRRTVDGPVQQQVEIATGMVLERMGTEMVITGARRHDVPRLPARVVREALANAVAHRSYELDTSPVVVEIRPNEVVVTSPGSLPPPVSVETLRQAQSPRNHTVIDVLRRFGLAEDSGQGIDIMQDSMRLEMLREPGFSESSDSFRVVLPLRGLMSTTERAWLLEYEREGRLLPEERGLLLVLLREGRLTNARAREALSVDSTDVRTRLRRLCKAGLMTQHGTRGRAYYTLGRVGPDRTDQQVVMDAAGAGPITNEKVRRLTGLDRVAARTLLQGLVAEGVLEQHGTRRGTTYTLPSLADQALHR